ncbi:NAD(P)H-binding protein [Paenibacillus sp.]|uniref:NAD(P)H-binding protein n=1 Tax=Paenibacillus sp. TaxID=58172 RepID=UPI002D23D5FC|nr:NAD(P)H-binding protein [Paenibacillus sp.]HZG88062.1 NAD(P)H-binding protein [Paenibacillus sp.]
MEQTKHAVLLGATGLIGRHVLERLLASPAYDTVTAVVRKPLTEHPKLRQIVLEHFDAMPADAFEGAEDVFCALGTTMKQARTREKFRQVDHDYPLAAAERAKAAGVKRYLLVSAMGADPASKIFYNRVKGETEADIRALQIPMLTIVRPSLLLGQRERLRLGETFAEWLSRPLSPLFRGPLFKYRPIEAAAVAAVLVRAAQMYTPGTHVYENDQLHRMAPNS